MDAVCKPYIQNIVMLGLAGWGGGKRVDAVHAQDHPGESEKMKSKGGKGAEDAEGHCTLEFYVASCAPAARDSRKQTCVAW